MLNVLFPIIKIVVHKSDVIDTVFIFTGIRTPIGDYVQIQIPCPSGEGEAWVFQTFKTLSFEVVLEGFEVVAPF